jgi:nitroimidazol reductase NimA-like FMN-containing flavoprotein (pyridoxamine 5'-phosphate oxidase superfamily)
MGPDVERPLGQPGVEVLDEHDCLELLRESDVGRLAVVVAESPEIFPINFIVDHGTVVFRTAEGTKLASIATTDAVAFEADGYDAVEGIAWSVIVKGRATEVRNLHERFDAADLPLFPWQLSPKPRIIRIVPNEITGRRFLVADHPAVRSVRRASPE